MKCDMTSVYDPLTGEYSGTSLTSAINDDASINGASHVDVAYWKPDGTMVPGLWLDTMYTGMHFTGTHVPYGTSSVIIDGISHSGSYSGNTPQTQAAYLPRISLGYVDGVSSGGTMYHTAGSVSTAAGTMSYTAIKHANEVSVKLTLSMPVSNIRRISAYVPALSGIINTASSSILVPMQCSEIATGNVSLSGALNTTQFPSSSSAAGQCSVVPVGTGPLAQMDATVLAGDSGFTFNIIPSKLSQKLSALLNHRISGQRWSANPDYTKCATGVSWYIVDTIAGGTPITSYNLWNYASYDISSLSFVVAYNLGTYVAHDYAVLPITLNRAASRTSTIYPFDTFTESNCPRILVKTNTTHQSGGYVFVTYDVSMYSGPPTAYMYPINKATATLIPMYDQTPYDNMGVFYSQHQQYIGGYLCDVYGNQISAARPVPTNVYSSLVLAGSGAILIRQGWTPADVGIAPEFGWATGGGWPNVSINANANIKLTHSIL